MIVLEQLPSIRRWAEKQLDCRFGKCYTIANQFGGRIKSVAVYSNFRGCGAEISLYSEGGITRDFIRVCFGYAFDFCKWNRLTALVKPDNKKSIRLIERMGFVKEGVIRCATDNGEDLVIYGLLREECKWVAEKAAAA